MTKTSSSSLRYARARILFFAAVGISLNPPLGVVSDLLVKENPWHSFSEQGPVLMVVRAQKIPKVSCDPWLKALASDTSGNGVGNATEAEWEAGLSEWSPWKEDDVEAITDCESMPCDVKLNAAETAQIKGVPEKVRQRKFFSVVRDRVERYQNTLERKEYEFPGDPVDPWKVFEDFGLKSTVPLPAKIGLWIRKLDFFSTRARAVRQVLDQRVAIDPQKKSATLWRRDVYTDHYFDSWGEWAQVSCDPATGSVQVILATLLELDLMKKTDLFSKLMRSKMRGATEDNGAVYLDQWFERLRKNAH